MKPRAIAMLVLGGLNAAGATVLAQGAEMLPPEWKLGVGAAVAAVGFVLASLNSTTPGHIFQKKGGAMKLPLILLTFFVAGCGTLRVTCPDLQFGELNSVHCEVNGRDVAGKMGQLLGLTSSDAP